MALEEGVCVGGVLTVAALCTRGIEFCASTDRLYLRSFPNYEVGRVLPTRSDVVSCDTGLRGSGTP